jgi:hypothetical protein
VRTDVAGGHRVPGRRVAYGVDDVGRVERAGYPAVVVCGTKLLPVLCDFGLGPARLSAPVAGEPVKDRCDVADALTWTCIDLVGVRRHVDVQHGGLYRPRLDELDSVETDRDDQVSIAQELPEHPVARHVEHAGEERVVLREDPLGHWAHHDRG